MIKNKEIYIYLYEDKLFIYPQLGLYNDDFNVVNDFERELVVNVSNTTSIYEPIHDYLVKPLRRVEKYLGYYGNSMENSIYYKTYKKDNIVNSKLKASIIISGSVNKLDDSANLVKFISDRRLNSKYIYGFSTIPDISLDDKEAFLMAFNNALKISLEGWESDPEYQKKLAKKKR